MLLDQREWPSKDEHRESLVYKARFELYFLPFLSFLARHFFENGAVRQSLQRSTSTRDCVQRKLYLC